VDFNPEVLDRLAQALHDAGYLRTNAETEELMRTVAAQAASSNPTVNGKGKFNTGSFSISRAINGAVAAAGKHLRGAANADEDIAYMKRTLLTGTTPGSYLVPAIQADTIIQLLTSAHVIRIAGARVWPMKGIQKLNVPAATASPSIVWGDSSGAGAGGQGQALTPTDLNLGQVALDLHSAKALTSIPNELLATAVPAVDQIISEILGLSFAQAEMNSMVATTQGTGMPKPLYAASGTTVINSNGGSDNGGAVKFTDLLGVVGQFYAQKGKGNPCWFMHPTVFYKDVMGILDSSNRPIITGFDSLEGPFQGRLFGFPVYVSAEFPTNQAVGSGTNQSYIAFTNPQYLHIGDEGGLELQISFERYFDSNATAIRGVRRVDYGYAPAAAIVILAGVNV
jgi:HK97 family phage major capsid protein